MINYNAALPAQVLSGRRSINLNQWIGDVKGSLTAIARSLFGSGDVDGLFFDPNDFSTMFQDLLGTVPVTEINQPVALILGKDKGLALGPELIQDPFFNDASYWKSDGISTKIVNSNAVFTEAATGANVNKELVTTLGKIYRCTLKVKSISSGAVRVNSSLGTGSIYSRHINNPGTYTFLIPALGTIPTVQITAIGVTNAEVSELSVRELMGNHAYQVNSAARPILKRNEITKAYYIYFDGVDDHLVTSDLDLSAAQELSIFAGVVKLRDSSTYEYLIANGNLTEVAGLIRLRLSSSGESMAEFNPKTYVAVKLPFNGELPQARSIVAKANTKTTSYLYSVNKEKDEKKISSTAGGSFSKLPMYIGRQQSNSWQSNMELYGLILVAKDTSIDTDSKIQNIFAKQCGVSLSV